MAPPAPHPDPCCGSAPAPVVHLRGELDLVTQASSRALLRPWAATPALQLVVVTREVTFADCAGLRPLREAAAALAARGGLVVLPAPARSVVRVLQLTGTDGGLVLREEAWRCGSRAGPSPGPTSPAVAAGSAACDGGAVPPDPSTAVAGGESGGPHR